MKTKTESRQIRMEFSDLGEGRVRATGQIGELDFIVERHLGVVTVTVPSEVFPEHHETFRAHHGELNALLPWKTTEDYWLDGATMDKAVRRALADYDRRMNGIPKNGWLVKCQSDKPERQSCENFLEYVGALL